MKTRLSCALICAKIFPAKKYIYGLKLKGKWEFLAAFKGMFITLEFHELCITCAGIWPFFTCFIEHQWMLWSSLTLASKALKKCRLYQRQLNVEPRQKTSSFRSRIFIRTFDGIWIQLGGWRLSRYWNISSWAKLYALYHRSITEFLVCFKWYLQNIK